MAKIKIRSLSAVGIVYLESNPSQVLINVNNDHRSPRVFQWTLDLIGGEWKGPLAKADANPLATFKRSAEEDLSITFKQDDSSASKKDGEGISREQSSMFLDFRKSVINKAVPWQDYLVTVDEDFLSTRLGGSEVPYEALVSYQLVGLDESKWLFLQKTLERFKNVSKSGLSHVATYKEIIAQGQLFGFGHETAMIDFWTERGYSEASQLKRLFTTPAKKHGKPLSNYKEYVATYNFERKP